MHVFKQRSRQRPRGVEIIVTDVLCRSTHVGVRHVVHGNRSQTFGNFSFLFFQRFDRDDVTLPLKTATTTANKLFGAVVQRV